VFLLFYAATNGQGGSVKTSGSQSGRYRPPGVIWTIQGVDK